MVEKAKSGSRVGIALVGAFATTAGIGEITLKRTGQHFDRLLTCGDALARLSRRGRSDGSCPKTLIIAK
jgi:hypothetical protein